MVVPPEAAFKAFGDLPSWWDPEHTYSGDSANLSFELVPGGCLCEHIPKTGGGVEHMRVAYVDPGKRVVLTGALGPLALRSDDRRHGRRSSRPSPADRSSTLDYKVAGFANGGADKLAPAVDGVLADQLKRLRSYATSRPKA